jgi:integrase
MARATNLLTARTAAALTDAGRHADGGGLFLDVRPGSDDNGTSRSWLFIYRSPVHRTERKAKDGTALMVGRTREMGLGSFGLSSDKVSLAAARDLAEAARRLLRERKDPLDERERAAKPAVKVPTFGELADQFIEGMEGQWRNEKHRAQWRMTLKEYAATIRGIPVNEIGVEDVLGCLKPHWERRPETADRLRGRIERVLNAAKAKGLRTGENPAAWRGHLENLLPKRQKLSRGHHAAMRWADVPGFVTALRKREGVAALALEFLILTAVRSGEARGAVWAEFDLTAKVWTIPAERMKAAVEHRVPLTDRMLAILETVKPLRRADDIVFPGIKPGTGLSDMTLAAVLKRMKIDNATPHGFRSGFRDWAGSATSYPREIAEEALAHTVGSKVERAYRRQDALERRRDLMAAWERYCEGGSNVVALKKVAQV